MSYHRSAVSRIIAVAAMLCALPAAADTVEARCDIYPRGEDHATAMLACSFSQRQGYVTIARSDGVIHELSPTGDTPGNFVDAEGAKVYRQSGLGKQGLIFRLPEESVYVYWATDALDGDAGSDNNPTAPYTTPEYDATTLLSCSMGTPSYIFECPAGIKRGLAGEADIRVMNPHGDERHIEFRHESIAAPQAERIDGSRVGDEWLIVINDDEFFRIPEAAITGG